MAEKVKDFNEKSFLKMFFFFGKDKKAANLTFHLPAQIQRANTEAPHSVISTYKYFEFGDVHDFKIYISNMRREVVKVVYANLYSI